MATTTKLRSPSHESSNSSKTPWSTKYKQREADQDLSSSLVDELPRVHQCVCNPFPKKIDEAQLSNADHIVVSRKYKTLYHNGIVQVGELGVLRVFHHVNNKGGVTGYTCNKCHVPDRPENNGVVKSCLSCFLQGSSLRRFDYKVSPFKMMVKVGGSCSTRRCDSADEVQSRVMSFYNSDSGFGKYDARFNNCEAFAIYCKTGFFMKRSLQVVRGVTPMELFGAGFAVRYPLYMVYAKLLGPLAVIPISGHIAFHRLRSVRVDKRLNLTSRSQKVPVDELMAREPNYFLKAILHVIH